MSRLGRIGASAHELLRDHTRDQFCSTLKSLGVEAHLLPRDVAEEGMTSREDVRSLGVIGISSGPIRWANILADKDDDGSLFFVEYGVPDPRLAATNLEPLSISSYRVRSIPVAGRVVDIRWQGDDVGTGILSALNGDRGIETRMSTAKSIGIRAYPVWECWTLSTSLDPAGPTGLVYKSPLLTLLLGWLWPPILELSRSEWDCYEHIAMTLLSANCQCRFEILQ